ncbi:MAG: DUF418 domain-containing protein [Kineosporiaceae bacterium]
MTAATAPPAEPQPRTASVPRGERSLAPDLARGSVLLFIALANVSTYFYGREVGPGHRPVDASSLDRVLDFAVTLLVDRRSWPMFALLLGYGLWQITHRQQARGTSWPATRGILVRRGLWLFAFGGVHALLLFDGDILGPYGLSTIVMLLFLRRSARALVAWGLVSLVLLTAAFGVLGAVGVGEVPYDDPSYLISAVNRLIGWTVTTVATALFIGLLAPMAAGLLMGRAGWLDRPWDHVGALRRVAVWGTAASVLGGLPFALQVAGVLPASPFALLASSQALHTLTGVAGGAAYVAIFALIAVRLRNRPRRGLIRAFTATGERSLTCYLLQSVAFAPLLSAWGLGWGGIAPTSAGYALAVVVWAATVVVAVLLDRAGRRGPFEVALRRLTYRPGRTGRGGGPAAAA